MATATVGAKSGSTGPQGGVVARAIALATTAAAPSASTSNLAFTSGRSGAAWSRIWWV